VVLAAVSILGKAWYQLQCLS